MKYINIFLLSIFCFATNSISSAETIGLFDLQYTLKYDLDDPEQLNAAWDHVHTAATLQGIVNCDAPRLFLFFVNRENVCIDKYWWDIYTKPGEWLAGRETLTYAGIAELVTAYKNDINGVVVYDPAAASTSNVASAIAGAENLIAIRYDLSPNSLYTKLVLEGPKLPVKCLLIQEDGTPMFTGKGNIPGTERPSTGSIKCDPYIWYIEHYMKKGKCNPEFGAYYIDQKWREKPRAAIQNHHTLSNHDFFVAQKAFFFDLSPWGDEPATDDLTQPLGTDFETLKEFLLTAYNLSEGKKICYIGGFPAWAFKYTDHANVGGKHEGVATEWEFSRIISAYNAFKDADAIGLGAIANASFWQHFPLKDKYEQKWVTHEELQKRGYLTEDGKVDFKEREFMIFYVGDYDASSWVYQTVPAIWHDPNRSQIPLMWCISPVLAKRVPMALHHIRETASPNDYFAAADNGAGYLMPAMLQEPRGISGLPSGLDAWANHCKPLYEKWGLTVTGFVIDGTTPGLNQKGLDCYALFSPNGIVPQKVPFTLLHGEMPVLRADYDINSANTEEAAQVILDRIRDRPVPFHWFRSILKTPTWHLQVAGNVQKKNPKVELLDTPTFFALYKIYLETTPNAAKGQIR